MPTDPAAPMTARERARELYDDLLAMLDGTGTPHVFGSLEAQAKQVIEHALTEHTAALTAKLAEVERMLAARDRDLASEVRVNVALNEELEATERRVAEAVAAERAFWLDVLERALHAGAIGTGVYEYLTQDATRARSTPTGKGGADAKEVDRG